MRISGPARSLPTGVLPRVSAVVRAFAFWTAVVLPFLYLPLLATGLDSVVAVLTFVSLLALNACALVVGQPTDGASGLTRPEDSHRRRLTTTPSPSGNSTVSISSRPRTKEM